MTGYRSQMVYVPLVGGLDTKSDEKTVVPTKLTLLENGDFTEGGSVRTRAGYTAVQCRDQTGAVIANPLGLAALREGWVLFTRRTAYGYDPKQVRWSELGPYCPATNTLRDVAPTSVAQSVPSMASASGVTAVAWEDSRGGVRCTVYNEETGIAYASEYELATANASRPSVVAVGANLLIAWFDDANDAVKARLVKASDPAGSVQDPDLTLAADADTSGAFDLTSGTDVAYLAFSQDPAVVAGTVLKMINQAGSVVQTATIGTEVPVKVRVAYDASLDVVWVVYTDAGNIAYIKSFAGDDLAADASATQNVASSDNLAIGANESGGVTLWVDTADLDHRGNDLVTIWRRDDAGAAIDNTVVRHAKVATSGWFDGVGSYCVLWFDTRDSTNLQSSYFLYRDDAVVCGRMLYGSADEMNSRVTAKATTVSRVSNRVDDRWLCALSFRRRVTAAKKHIGIFEHRQIKACEFNMSAPVSSVQVDGVLYASGSMLWAIDGAGPPVEQAPLLFPDMARGATFTDGFSGFDGTAGTAGLVATKTYWYRAYYEATYGRNKRVRSAALEVKYTVGGADETMEFRVPTLSHTRYNARSPASIVGYRTEGNKADLYYRITSVDPDVTGNNGYEANTLTADAVIIDDILSDANLIDEELDYLSRGENPHFAPDGPTLVAVAQNRLFVSAGGEKPGALQYSLSTLDDGPVEFTDASLLSELPKYGGAVTALARINDTLVVLFERALCYLDGTGFSNVGTGEQYRTMLVSTDVGCNNGRAVCEWDRGLLFQSAKGIYSLDQNFQVEYIGAYVERYNDQEFTAATLVPDTNMVLFLCAGSDERTLMYDYFYREWGTYTNHAGLAAAATSGQFAYLRSDGKLYIRTPGSSMDPGDYVKLKFRTAPLRMEGLENEWLLRSFQVLGDYNSSHEVVVGVYYDGNAWPTQESRWKPDEVLNINVWGDEDLWGSSDFWYGDSQYTDYHFERRFKRSRARSVAFEFTGFPKAAPGSAFEVTEIALEVALLPGPKRLARSRKI